MAWDGVRKSAVGVVGVAVLGCVPAADPAAVGSTGEPSTGVDDPSTSTGDVTTGTTGIDESSTSSSSTTAAAPVCGDGVLDETEACDDGPDNGEAAACLPDCSAASCGDGFVRDGVEACDDGNDDDTDACTSVCEVAACGDGSVQGEEECDDGENNSDFRACKSDCTAAACGDGVIFSGEEQCDDGNDDNNDGCSELCLFTDCGDGFWNPEINEVCDDGPGSPGDVCNDDCLTWGLWTETFNGSGSSNDLIHGVAFDSVGNPVVAGVTLPDNGDGDDIWVRKYDPTGAAIWTQTFHGGVTSDIGYGVAVAPNDDVFVVGSSFTLSDNRDIWVRRYAPNGTPGFTRTHNGSDDEADEGLGIAIDGAGNLGVVGYVTQGSDREIFIRKYTPAGGTQWTVVESGPGGSEDEAHGVGFDAAGNLVATGFVSTGGGAEDLWVGKYDPAGVEQWTLTHAGSGGENDRGEGVAVDSAGNAVVVGFEAVAGEGDNAWIRKLDPDGAELWTETFNGPTDGRDRARGVAVAGSDEIVVVGSTFAGSQSDNIWVRRYDADGNEAYPWATEYNSPGFLSDVANGVAVDGDGNVAVGGFETRSENGEARNTWLRYVLP